ncbi:MAG: ATP-binding protein [Mariprofundaceae bacterium]|nr:ATP-binding protein [Mariprofundaceae bacterium]
MRKKLPVGIQTFEKMVGEGCCYVDKTALIQQLVEGGQYYFISRPRRFGKSLLVSTLASLFAGQRELFQGLAIEPHWDWSTSYPVIHISFGGGIVDSRELLEITLQAQLREHAIQYAVTLHEHEPANLQFRQLILALHQKFNASVVLLVDEYDKPILDNLVAGRDDTAIAVREGLKGFYSVIKDSDRYIRFALLTGVSKFSKVSLFSGLNNLEDITLSPRFASLCGYTDAELRHTFAAWLNGVDMNEVRRWYNGYNFDGEPVYNPFDVLLYLKERQFRNYWFETGSPSFLIRMLQQHHYYIPDLNTIEADNNLLSSFDVGYIEVEPLLFQTGYLTIESKQQIAGDWVYKLKTPNYEVWHSLHKNILNYLVNRSAIRQKNSLALYRCLESGEPHELRAIFHSFFASIPHDWYRNNQLARYEGYYCSIVYCYFVALGLDVIAEDTTSQGRIDMTVKFGKRIFIIEFKVVEMEGDSSAIAQIEAKGYAEKYMGQGDIYLIGVSFNSNERNIVGFDVRSLS